MSSILPDIEMNVLDGGLGLAPNLAGGVAGIIGESSLGDSDPHVITSENQIATLYGTGKLPQALRDALAAGARALVACRVTSVILTSTPAELGDATRVATGLVAGAMEASEGNTSPACTLVSTSLLPGAGTIEVKVTTGGDLGVDAMFSARVNGGTWSDPAAIAASVNVALTGAAFVLGFAAGTYVLNDTWSAPIVAGGSGTIVATGTPEADGLVRVNVLTTGSRNTGHITVLVDGVAVQTNVTIPADGQLEVEGLCHLSFDLGLEDPQFVAGDAWTVECTGPVSGVEDLAAAALKIRGAGLPTECIHIVGATSPSTWAALDVLALTEFKAKGRFLFFLVEAPDVAENQTEAAWALARVAEPVTAGSLTRVAVFAGWIDPAGTRRSGAASYLGHLLKLKKLSFSPGRVKSGSVGGVTTFGPTDEGIIAQLDVAGFTTFRRWDGLSGTYVTNGRMLVDETSDFRWVEYRRVMDYACRVVRLAGLRSEHDEGDPAGLKALQSDLQLPLDRMIAARLCAGARADVPEGQDVVGTSTVAAKVSVQPIPAMRWITVDIGFTRGETA